MAHAAARGGTRQVPRARRVPASVRTGTGDRAGFDDLTREAVDQAAARDGRTQRAEGDGATVERLWFRDAVGPGEKPAPRQSPPPGGPLRFRLAVDGWDVVAVQRFGESSSTHPANTGVATETI